VTEGFAELFWPPSRLAEGVEALAGLLRLPVAVCAPRAGPVPEAADVRGVERSVEHAAARLGLELEPLAGPATRSIASAVSGLPTVVQAFEGQARGFLLIVARRGNRLSLLAPDGSVQERAVLALRDLLASPIVATFSRELINVLAESGVPPDRQRAVTRWMFEHRLTWFQDGWHLRIPPSGPWRDLLAHAGVFRRLGWMLVAYTALNALWIGSWWLIGDAALEGIVEPSLLFAWALMLVTTIPLRLVVSRSQAKISVAAGALLKRRLLAGALRLDLDEIRAEGSGQLMGRVFESEAVETLALTGGLLSLLASVEILGAVAVLALGAGGPWHAVSLVAWVALTLAVAHRFGRTLDDWTRLRIEITHALVEKMVGHRTRLAQEPRSRWHDGEDQELERYHRESRNLDVAMARVSALVPRGWLVLGTCGLAVPFATTDAPIGALAAAAGGILLGYRALARFSSGLLHLTAARTAWRNVAPLFHAAARPVAVGAVPARSTATRSGEQGPALLEAEELTFKHALAAAPVLKGASLRIHEGDRILLVAESGAGKSTLVSLLAGLRHPSTGLLLCSGLDLHTLGEAGWRRDVALAPQFHENHVLPDTMAFNLLLGRGWPPSPGDLEEARSLCAELGLDALLARMPGDLQQMVGESGWQLSHGERSRLYLARAILQRADVVVLDESFAALDHDNLVRCLEVARRRARALLVIAHP
jgi:ATP-binding cassette subfamily B protein